MGMLPTGEIARRWPSASRMNQWPCPASMNEMEPFSPKLPIHSDTKRGRLRMRVSRALARRTSPEGVASASFARRTVRVSELVIAARKPWPDASPKQTVAWPFVDGMKSTRSPERRGPGSDACWKRYSPKVVRAGAYRSADGRVSTGVSV